MSPLLHPFTVSGWVMFAHWNYESRVEIATHCLIEHENNSSALFSRTLRKTQKEAEPLAPIQAEKPKSGSCPDKDHWILLQAVKVLLNYSLM